VRTVNEAACWVSGVAFEHGVPREFELRKHTYAELKALGLGAQAAQHVIKKTRDAYTTRKANIKAGNFGKPGSKRRTRAESKPIAFRREAAQPYDDRCLSLAVRRRNGVDLDDGRAAETRPLRLPGRTHDAPRVPQGRVRISSNATACST
jgi:hypothetical protein